MSRLVFASPSVEVVDDSGESIPAAVVARLTYLRAMMHCARLRCEKEARFYCALQAAAQSHVGRRATLILCQVCSLMRESFGMV
jgi:hypothetical protein